MPQELLCISGGTPCGECGSLAEGHKKWCGRLLNDYDRLMDIMGGETYKPSFRAIAHYTRLSLMLADHYISSCLRKQIRADGQKMIYGRIQTVKPERKSSFWRNIWLGSVNRQPILPTDFLISVIRWRASMM